MINEYKILSEIIELCLSIDLKSCTTYNKFALESENLSLAAEWKLRAGEERNHILFWKQALVLSEQKQLPLIFKNPVEVRDKLKKITKKIEQIFSKFNNYKLSSEQLTLSFLLESYMLNPAFMTMFHDYSFIDKSIENDYEKHILVFIDMIKCYHDNLNSLKVETFSETLYDLYLANKQLLKSSLQDSLTGLYNRRGFFDNIKPLLSLASRKNTDIGIIMIDFDDFKKVNDLSGHQIGDRVLKKTAAVIESDIRASCISARYGGDEFIVFSDIKNAESLHVICERIRKNIGLF